MIKVGLTGGIGSGKTIVCNVFSALGVPVYNADNEAKRIMASGKIIKELGIVFGNNIIVNGELDRKALANIVFNNPKELSKLNALVHPLVKDDFAEWAQNREQSKYVIQETAILFESGFEDLFDKIITVSADKSIRLKRVVSRDNAAIKAVEARMARQLTDQQRENKSDFVIFNNDTDMLLPQILKIHQTIISS